MIAETLAVLQDMALPSALRASRWVYPVVNAGHIAGQLRRYDDAVAYCRRAVAVRPDDAEGWYLLGLGLFSNGERAAAEQALHRSLALSADDAALRTKTQQLLGTLQQQPTGTP